MTDHTHDGKADGPSREGDRSIESRLRAVERAVTGSETRPADVADGAAATAERERLADRVDDLEARVEELEAATEAVRGYAGAVRAVNREVERRADLALARATEAAEGRNPEGTDDGEIGDIRPERNDEPPDAVPSESALDAAVPEERPTAGAESDDGDTPARSGDDADDESWGTDALERLRESL